MDDRLEAFEIEPSYDREDPFPRGPRVLWGRVAALSGGLILAFLIGHMTGGGGSATNTSLQNEVNSDRTTIAQLQQSLAAASAGATTTPSPTASLGGFVVPTSTVSPTPTSTASSTPASGASVTYTVKVGDTIGSIASHFYGRTSHAAVVAIEQANNLADATIRVGMKLTIPPSSTFASTTPTETVTTSPSPRVSASPTAKVSPKASPSH